MTNIEFFNRMTLAVFERLYCSFPTPLDLDVKAIAMAVIPEDADFDDTFDALQAADDAVDFLAEEGFLTHKGTFSGEGTFVQARLTLRGLAILGSPASLEVGDRQSLIEHIRKALSGGAKEAGTEVVKQLTQKAFAAAVAAGPLLLARLST